MLSIDAAEKELLTRTGKPQLLFRVSAVSDSPEDYQDNLNRLVEVMKQKQH